MGAMLRFKEVTGKEVTEIKPKNKDLHDLCALLWACTTSACKREGVEFNMDLMTFADSIDPADMAAWERSFNKEAAGTEEKADAAGTEKKSR